MTGKFEIDPLRMQRLVDGELSQVDRSQLLKEIEREPRLWREVALLLLEDQSYRKQIPQSVLEERTASLTVLREAPEPVALPSRRTVSMYRPWLMLAACFLFLVSGAWMGRQIDMGSFIDSSSLNPGQVAAAPTLAEAGASTLHNNSTEANPEAARLKLVDLRDNERSAWDVPVYQVDRFDPRMIFGTDLDDFMRINAELRKQGYELDVQSHLVQGELPDGRSVVVPIRNVGLKTFGQ